MVPKLSCRCVALAQANGEGTWRYGAALAQANGEGTGRYGAALEEFNYFSDLFLFGQFITNSQSNFI